MPKLSQMWKEKTIEVLKNLYGDELDEEKLSLYLDKILAEKQAYFPVLSLRNLYTTEHKQIPLDDILDVIKQEDLCIEANNTLTYSLNRVHSPLPKILVKQKADRNFHKKKMLKAKEEVAVLKKAGKYYEGCPEDVRMKSEDALQLKIKIFMNSVYGVQGQKGSFLYAPDTAGAVTSQGREMIAEMTWTTERIFYGTLHFYSVNELIGYIHQIKQEVNPNSEWLKYIDYIPTQKDVENQIIKALNSVEHLDDYINNLTPVLFAYIRRMTPIERIYYYYANNLFDLYSKNYKVFKLFDDIINLKIGYLAPAYPPSDSDNEKFSQFLNIDYTITDSAEIINSVPDEDKKALSNYLVWNKINPALDKIWDIVNDFVVVHMSTPKRALKYQTKRRRAIVVSDTDSIIVNLNPMVINLNKLHCIENNLPYRGDEVSFYDEPLGFKLVNMAVYILIKGTVVAGDIFCKGANIPAEYRKWIDMKNEFLFKRLVMFSQAKKNYVVNTRLQEGKVIDEMPATGIKLNSSVIHPEVKKQIMDIIEQNIVRSQEINPIEIMLKVKKLEKWIVDSIKAGDLTLGRKARYSGPKGYKTGVYRNDAGRSAFIWNILYPQYKINAGDYGYVFQTTLYTEEDVKKKLGNTYPEVAEMLLEKIFKDENLKQYGLRSIMIPMGNEDITKLPDWIIKYVDYNRITRKHLSPISTLLPSIGLKNSAMSSSQTTYSPLISF